MARLLRRPTFNLTHTSPSTSSPTPPHPQQVKRRAKLVRHLLRKIHGTLTRAWKEADDARRALGKRGLKPLPASTQPYLIADKRSKHVWVRVPESKVKEVRAWGAWWLPGSWWYRAVVVEGGGRGLGRAGGVWGVEARWNAIILSHTLRSSHLFTPPPPTHLPSTHTHMPLSAAHP